MMSGSIGGKEGGRWSGVEWVVLVMWLSEV